jgi:hypothetical protein
MTEGTLFPFQVRIRLTEATERLLQDEGVRVKTDEAVTWPASRSPQP